jgi:hypothetical protein
MRQNLGSITLLFSDCMPRNGAAKNIRVTLPKFCSHLDLRSRHKHALSVTPRLSKKE